MSDATAIHPTPEVLTAFGLGKLTEAETEVIARHLTACEDCRRLVEGVAPDSLVGLVRSAKQATVLLATGLAASPFPARAAVSQMPGTGAPPPAPADLPLELADHPRYKILRVLGWGGMGVVYEAEHRHMGRKVALKVISQSLVDHPEAVERFTREVHAAAKLNHPNIVTAFDAEQAGSLHLLVMEYVEGQSLAQMVEKKGPLPVAYACHFARQAALGLQHAFEQGMVHRDLKPHNLMVTPKGQVKILDFGLARLVVEKKVGPGLTADDAVMGTPEYLAPEQALDARQADVRADIYSLGCTLYFLLAGQPPFPEGTAMQKVMAHLEKEPRPLPEVRADMPAALWAVMERMLAKDPSQRYQQAVEVAQALIPFIKAGAKPPTGARAVPPGVSAAGVGTVMGGDTSKVLKLRKDAAEKPSVQAAPAKDELLAPFENLADDAVRPSRAKKARAAAKPAPAAWLRGRRILVGAGAAVLILGLAGLWDAGVFKVNTPQGTIILGDVPDNAKVLVDGPTVTVTQDGEVVTVTAVSEGPYRLKVVLGGREIWSSGDVRVKLGGDALRLRVEPRGPTPTAAQGKHVVLISGDAEYRSEQALPQLAKILAKHHAFRCTVLYAIDPKDGMINPEVKDNIPGLEALKTADLMIIATSLRELPDEQMKHIVDYLESARPVIGMRTATHAFANKDSKVFAKYSFRSEDGGFGRQVLGETWVGHHGKWPQESTRGIFAKDQAKHPILRGIKDGDIWVPSNVYSVHLPLPGDSQPLMLGEVLDGLRPTDKPVAGWKNNPLMPVAWTKTYTGTAGKAGRVFTTTMGAATDLESEGLRRLLVNAVYWAVGMEGQIPEKSNVDLVGEYKPLPNGVGGFEKGVKPPDAGFVPLFNGKDLTGWESFPGDKSRWEIKDGILTSGGGRGDLFSKRGDYENFHLRAEVKINDGGNSGIYFRSLFRGGFPPGYEAQINATHPDPQKTGSLYNIVKVLDQLHKPGAWFTLEVIAEGEHLVILVNGKKVVDVKDATYAKGHFALQQHDPGTVVEFRKIEIKELPVVVRGKADPSPAVRVIDGHQNPVVLVLFTPDGSRLVSASNGDHHEVKGNVRYHVTGTDNSVRVWNLESGKQIRKFEMPEGHHYGPQGMALSPDGRLLAVAASWIWANGYPEPRVHVWDLTNGQRKYHFVPPGDRAMRAVGFWADGNTISAVRSGQGVHSWSLADGKELAKVDLEDQNPGEAPKMTLTVGCRYIVGGVFGPGGKNIRLWDRATGKVVRTFTGHTTPATQVVMSPDETRILSCAADFSVRLWETESGRELPGLSNLDSNVLAVAFSSDGRWFLTGEEDGSVRLWDTATVKELARFRGHTAKVNCVTFSPSSRLAASGSDDHTIRLWQLP
jgi:WD40 repeat protein